MDRSAPPDLPTEPMDVATFLDWSDRQPEGSRYELVDGFVVVDQARQQMRHARAKQAATRALERAAAGMPCESIPDGMALEVSAERLRQPDAMLRCGDPLPGEALTVTDAVIVVEVTSPSTASTDLGDKLIDYGRVASVAHYLIVETRMRVVLHYRRTAEGWATTILPGGTVALDPPGIALDLDPVLAALD